MLRVVLDITPYLLPRPSGIGWYVASLLQGLQHLPDQGLQLGVYYQPGLKNWLRGRWSFPAHIHLEGVERYLFPLPVRLSNLCIRFPQLFLPSLERCLGSPDIVHGTNYTVFPCRHSQRVMTLYDLTFIRYPQFTNATVKAYIDYVRRCLGWTDLVLTISESSRQDIIHYLGVPAERVWVTPLASRYELSMADQITVPTGPTDLYDFSQPYILFVSTIEPRKNITGLIAAFNDLKQKHQLPHQLVLIGQRGWRYQGIFAAIAASPYQTSIHHLSYLPDEWVQRFYAGADVFVYPSHYEGFGLPVLEAMTLGAPVVTAKAASLPEVVGDAGLMVDPAEVTDLAEAILRVVSDRELRHGLITKGRERASLFSWQRTAQATLTAYQSLLP